LLVVGSVVGIGMTVYCSRRGFLIGAFVLLTLCLLAMSVMPSGHASLVLLLFAVFTLTISAVSNLVGVFPAESFPTDIRSLGVGFATSMSRLGSAIGTGLLPLSILSLGVHLTTLILAGVLLLGAIVSILWAPETKGLTLVGASSLRPELRPVPIAERQGACR